MHFLQAINSDISVLIVCNKTGGTIKGDTKKNCYSKTDRSFPVPQSRIRRFSSEKSESGITDGWSLLIYGHYLHRGIIFICVLGKSLRYWQYWDPI